MKSKRGLASASKRTRKEVARKGGKASHRSVFGKAGEKMKDMAEEAKDVFTRDDK